MNELNIYQKLRYQSYRLIAPLVMIQMLYSIYHIKDPLEIRILSIGLAVAILAILALFFYGTRYLKVIDYVWVVGSFGISIITLASNYFLPDIDENSVMFLLPLWSPMLAWFINLIFYNSMKTGLIYNTIIYLIISLSFVPLNNNSIYLLSWTDMLGIGTVFVYVSYSYYEMFQYVDRQIVTRKNLETLAKEDALTGAKNRHAFEVSLEQIAVDSKNKNCEFCLVLLDIDHFKHVNDQYGHEQGDVVLKEITAISHQFLRNRDMFFRWGGEEFAILLPETDISNATKLADALREKIAHYRFKVPHHITVSIGIANDQGESTAMGCFLRADQALYRAKEYGRNRVEIDQDLLTA